MNPQLHSSRTVSLFLLLCVLGAPVVQAETAAEANASLEAAELSFAASVAAKDIEAFASHIAENAIFAAGPVRNGKVEILEASGGWELEDHLRLGLSALPPVRGGLAQAEPSLRRTTSL